MIRWRSLDLLRYGNAVVPMGYLAAGWDRIHMFQLIRQVW